MSSDFLATLNACLNALSTVFLSAGYYFIRNKKIRQHRLCMLTSFAISCLFLVSYVVHHARVGSVPYQGPPAWKPLYLSVLVPHVLLAMLVPPLAIVTIRRALREDFPRHRRIARITFPIWLFVSVSGVVVYFMLYRL